MSDQRTDSTPNASSGAVRPPLASYSGGHSEFAMARPWKFPIAAVVVMVVLALVGVALTTSKNEWASPFWIALVPIYGLLCVATAWDRARRDPAFLKPGIVRQVFHWLGIGFALWLGFFIRRAGEETVTALSDNALLLLALGCFLAGVHLEWLFAVVGLLLMLTMVIVVEGEQYVWLIFVIGAAIIVALFVTRRIIARSRKLSATGMQVKPQTGLGIRP